MRSFFILALTLFPPILPTALAFEPARSIQELQWPRAETLHRVKSAKVVLADYGLIRNDFPSVHGLSEAQIDHWLLQKTAYISDSQLHVDSVNTPIELTGETAIAHRPLHYGRAVVFTGGPLELIDAKGVGVAPGRLPFLEGHANGLATLGEATREFLYEKLVQTALIHAGAHVETIGHYAVIDFGFNVIHQDGTESPAGLILRQAHKRRASNSSLFEAAEARAVELQLRPYGITTAGAYRVNYEMEWLNVQGSADGTAILDFGAYLTVEHFDKSAANFGTVVPILQPGEIDFVQPHADYRVPFDRWGFSQTRVADPKMDNPWIWSHDLAKGYRMGVLDRHTFKAHFETLVGDYRRHLFKVGGEARPGTMSVLVKALSSIH